MIGKKIIFPLAFTIYLELEKIRGGKQTFRSSVPFRQFLYKIDQKSAPAFPVLSIFNRPLLSYVAEQSASWPGQHM
jgi:hypothetical protein